MGGQVAPGGRARARLGRFASSRRGSSLLGSDKPPGGGALDVLDHPTDLQEALDIQWQKQQVKDEHGVDLAEEPVG